MARGNSTIKDIAKELGIAPSTVSRALKNHPDIGAPLTAQVKETARRLNYQPNTLAQNLRDRTTKKLGVIVPEIVSSLYASVLNGIEEVASHKGYHLIVCKSGESYQKEVQHTYSLISQVDGMLVSVSRETRKYDHFENVKVKNLPLLFFERVVESIQADKVVFNDYKIAYAITEHLIDSGFKRIAHITGPEYINISKDRIAGYVDAHKAAQLPTEDSLLVKSGFGYHDGRLGLQKLMNLSIPPDAIFCATDQISLGLYAEAKQRSISIPDQLGIASFAVDQIHSLLTPSVTTIRQVGFEMGSIAAQLCISQIESDSEPYKPQREVISTDLIIRQSSVNTPIGPSVSRPFMVEKGDTFTDLIYIY
ncbi:MAG: LacI family DNA-binding transcriptional regulator [Bacteroidetes bacterium]|nr:LacI family DNA-binding transcriptional regulator [Fibrella sp.]